MRGRAGVAALELLLREAWAGPNWLGPSLRRTVRELDADQAWWRPEGASHSAWDIVLHLAYWKHRVARRMTGGRGPRFARGPANWPAVPDAADPGQWREDVALLEATHSAFVELVQGLTDRDLDRPVGRHTVAESIRGIAAHDDYHGGQIRMLQRMGETVSGKR